MQINYNNKNLKDPDLLIQHNETYLIFQKL